jgi:transcription initiation factor IIE alpha subunit
MRRTRRDESELLSVAQKLGRPSGYICTNDECGYELPTYTGAYPKYCVRCGSPVEYRNGSSESYNESRASILLEKL